MDTPVSRRKMLHRMGLVEALPTLALQRQWALIDDRVPPEGEADGEFTSHLQWVNKASSWIGFSGAKCFDALDRPCRNGSDFARAHAEGAFPVRWYMPDRFPEPKAPLTMPELASLKQLVEAEGQVLPLRSIKTASGKSPVRRSVIASLEAKGFVVANDDTISLTQFGKTEFGFEQHRLRQASYIQRY